MNFALSAYPLRNGRLSGKLMTLLNPEAKAMLSAIEDIARIEIGNRSAREQRQQLQLRNLIQHAVQRSGFWRSRIGNRGRSDIDLASLPIRSRQDLRRQVASEGPLLRPALRHR
jgi:phenylacetate-CoA ligase